MFTVLRATFTCAHLAAARNSLPVPALDLCAWHARWFDQGSIRRTRAWVSLGTVVVALTE